MRHELIIDNFAGGGGASTGIEQAIGRPIDIAINHDDQAICMHKANHPATEHLIQSVWSANPRDLANGRPVGLVWFSPDCKHFSKAKGGKPVQKNIRDLAWVVPMWAKTVKPRIMIIENVEEFKTWGPLVDNKPCPIQKGFEFKKWIKETRSYGYKVEHKVMRACDFGAPTIRKRLFVICRSDNIPITWPIPTHGKGLLPYRTAAECIDWSNPAPSIFERKRPLAENTLKRIARGLKKFVFDNPAPFIISYYGPKSENDFRGQKLDHPIPTQTTENRFGLVTPYIATVNHSGEQFRGQGVDSGLNTITQKGSHAIITPFLTECANASGQRIMDIAEPLRTVTAETKGGTHALVTAFMAKHYSGATGCPIDTPCPTTTTRGTQNQIVTSHMIKMRGQNTGHKTDEPVHTISAGGNHMGEVRAFLVQYYGTSHASAINAPMNTITAKDRFGLVTIHGQEYQIVDIGMRMLQPRELYRAQGFPDDYIIDPIYNGKPLTKTAQVRMCGNSVCPPLARAIVEANYISMRKTA
ncbi:MAG: DNA cytosine methyltransferase [Emcibacter sp.]|nr:DNA cytosine methyltransferase [Emcibacter sp.]